MDGATRRRPAPPRRWCAVCRVCGDRGAVTVEAALALCSLVLVLALALSGLAAAAAQLRCQDAAREAARLVARGETDRARQAAAAVAPEGARVDIQVSGDEITVGVSGPGVGSMPGLVVSARAVGVLEPGVLVGVTGGEQGGGPTDGAPAPPGASGVDPSDPSDPATPAEPADASDSAAPAEQSAAPASEAAAPAVPPGWPEGYQTDPHLPP